MNKKYLFFIIILIIIIGIAGFILYNNYQNNKTHENTNNTTKLAIESNETNNEVQDAQKQNIIEKSNSVSNENRTEEEISSYSSPLKSKASGRLNNIKITCSALNGTIVHKGDTFSFCNTLGPSTAEKGYEKADVIINGKTEQALGGGNCQVSSTLYNAVLAVPDLEVVDVGRITPVYGDITADMLSVQFVEKILLLIKNRNYTLIFENNTEQETEVKDELAAEPVSVE